MKFKIDKVVYPGKGLGRTDEGMVVFVPGTFPGEIVEINITKQHKKFAEAELVEVLEKSEHRVEPVCPLCSEDAEKKCPGCIYQHVSYHQEVQLKNEQLKDLLTNLGKVDVSSCMKPPVPSPKELFYRNKILLHRDGKRMGYFSYDKSSIVDVEQCPLAVQEINELLSELRACPEFLTEKPEKKTFTLRYTQTDGALSWFGRKGSKNRKLKLTEKTNVGCIEVPTGAFFQVNPAVADILTSKIISLIRDIKPENCVDLYCGVGVHAFAASKAGVTNVLGIDIDEKSIKAGRKFAKENGMRISLLDGAAEKMADDALKVVSSPETAVIVDPPRKGLDQKVIKALKNNIPRHVIYISCAPDTLSRDIAKLQESGYELKSVQMLDMFPRTSHFETLTVLEKNYNI